MRSKIKAKGCLRLPSAISKLKEDGLWYRPGIRLLGVTYSLALDPKRECCLPGCSELMQLPQGLCSAGFQETLGQKLKEEKKLTAESAGVFNVMSGTSPPTGRLLQEMPFPLPGNKGVENFWAAAVSIKQCLISNRNALQPGEAAGWPVGMLESNGSRGIPNT